MSMRLGSGRRGLALRRLAGGLRVPGLMARLGLRPVLAALLGLVLVAELLPGNGGSGDALPAPSLPKKGGAIAAVDVQGWTQTILARPLFNPDRRPSGEAAGEENELPRLSAIIVGRGTASAIFAADGQKPLVVQPGGMVAGNKVRSISADEVVLLTAAGPVTLHPRFAKDGASAAGARPTRGSPDNPPASPRDSPPAPAGPVSPKTGQPENSTTTAGPYDNE